MVRQGGLSTPADETRDRRFLRSQRLAQQWRIARKGQLCAKRLLLTRRRRGFDESLVRLATFRLGPNRLQIGRRHRSWRPVWAAFAIRVHDAEIVLRVLVEVFGRNTVAAGGCFAGQRYVAFKDLICAAANFYVWTIAIESLNSVRQPRAVVVRIAPIAATARSLVWSWSHDTYLIAVNTVRPMSGGSVPWPLSGGCGLV